MKAYFFYLLLLLCNCVYGQTQQIYLDSAFKAGGAGDYQLAIHNLDEAIKLDSSNSTAYLYRGLAKNNLKLYHFIVSVLFWSRPSMIIAATRLPQPILLL